MSRGQLRLTHWVCLSTISLACPALLFGTTHGLTSTVIKPELAGQLTYIIQGLVVLFIGADVLILYVWNSRKKLRRAQAAVEAAKP